MGKEKVHPETETSFRFRLPSGSQFGNSEQGDEIEGDGEERYEQPNSVEHGFRPLV